MYQYLVTHVHAVPEAPPIVGGDVKGNLDSAYANFHTKVLNKDIRIS
jgi:hypothetical protein